MSWASKVTKSVFNACLKLVRGSNNTGRSVGRAVLDKGGAVQNVAAVSNDVVSAVAAKPIGSVFMAGASKTKAGGATNDVSLLLAGSPLKTPVGATCTAITVTPAVGKSAKVFDVAKCATSAEDEVAYLTTANGSKAAIKLKKLCYKIRALLKQRGQIFKSSINANELNSLMQKGKTDSEIMAYTLDKIKQSGNPKQIALLNKQVKDATTFDHVSIVASLGSRNRNEVAGEIGGMIQEGMARMDGSFTMKGTQELLSELKEKGLSLESTLEECWLKGCLLVS